MGGNLRPPLDTVRRATVDDPWRRHPRASPLAPVDRRIDRPRRLLLPGTHPHGIVAHARVLRLLIRLRNDGSRLQTRGHLLRLRRLPVQERLESGQHAHTQDRILLRRAAADEGRVRVRAVQEVGHLPARDAARRNLNMPGDARGVPRVLPRHPLARAHRTRPRAPRHVTVARSVHPAMGVHREHRAARASMPRAPRRIRLVRRRHRRESRGLGH